MYLGPFFLHKYTCIYHHISHSATNMKSHIAWWDHRYRECAMSLVGMSQSIKILFTDLLNSIPIYSWISWCIIVSALTDIGHTRLLILLRETFAREKYKIEANNFIMKRVTETALPKVLPWETRGEITSREAKILFIDNGDNCCFDCPITDQPKSWRLSICLYW